MYRSSPFRSTLNTSYITGLDMCKVCTEAVHSVALCPEKNAQTPKRGNGKEDRNRARGVFQGRRTSRSAGIYIYIFIYLYAWISSIIFIYVFNTYIHLIYPLRSNSDHNPEAQNEHEKLSSRASKCPAGRIPELPKFIFLCLTDHLRNDCHQLYCPGPSL